MIIYSESKANFTKDILDGVLEEKIESLILTRFGRHTGASEVNSWKNSLTYMGNVINGSDVPSDATVSIEYNIPYTFKRVDMIVSGLNADDHHVAVIIELKQWSSAEAVEGKDAVVRTVLGNGLHETVHPSYQAWSYAEAISDFNADVRDNEVMLRPCAFLHNYVFSEPEPLLSSMYSDYLDIAPLFSRHDGMNLVRFLNDHIHKGDGGETIFMIENGRLKPSKSLQDCISSMMAGNREFILLDGQKVVYEEVISRAKDIYRNGRKRTIVVRGGPGTGKTVLAVNILAKVIEMGLAAQYVSKNQAPRSVYSTRLKGGKGRSRVDKLFVGSGTFTESRSDTFDVLLADEAHRLNLKSGLFSNLGENQIREIINASRLSVFFIDEDQRVTLKDIGTIDEIERCATELGSEVSHCLLESQFRCSGSDGYLDWLDDVLQIHEYLDLEGDGFDFDFRVFDDPNQLRSAIEEKNAINNRSRLVAGYCWDWDSKHKSDSVFHDITIPEYGFGMSWNLGNTNTWAIDPESINEVGCIHTCQGLEFDYVGVIIGDDMRYENGDIITDASKRAKTDSSLKGLRKRYPDKIEAERVADRIIKNTYRVLMTRGMKGCYVYCTDHGLSEHLKERMI